MFDRTFVMPPRSEAHYITREVHEHRAPTDESVKLLREMEAAAEDKRISSMQMPGNLFNGVVETMHSIADGRILAKAIFDLNGQRCTAEAWVDSHSPDAKAELAAKLLDATAKNIAATMLIQTWRLN